MGLQKERQRELKTTMDDKEFEAWWKSIVNDRATDMATINRCKSDGSGNDGGKEDEQGEFDAQECDPNADEFVWNDHVITPIK